MHIITKKNIRILGNNDKLIINFKIYIASMITVNVMSANNKIQEDVYKMWLI